MKNQEIILAGKGGFGREVAAFMRVRNMPFRIMGFIDDEKSDNDVISKIIDHEVNPAINARYITCLGSGKARYQVRKLLEQRGAPFVSLIFPDVLCASDLSESCNSIFLGACSISCDVRIGDDLLIQGMAVIGHDVVIGDGVTVSSHAFIGGWATLGDFCTIHPHAVVLPHVVVGEGAVVGAGSVVIRDVEPYTTVFGTPAKMISRAEPHD